MIEQTKKDGRWKNGGARPGAGRKLQPSPKACNQMKRYLELTLKSDFKLMAHLALRPEDFEKYVIFGGTDETDEKGKSKSSGGYFLDPLFKERLSLLKFRLNKFLPDCPKEVEVSGEMEVAGLPPAVIQVLMQPVQTFVVQPEVKTLNLPESNKLNGSVIPSISQEPGALPNSTHGKPDCLPSVKPQDLLRSVVPTASVKP